MVLRPVLLALSYGGGVAVALWWQMPLAVWVLLGGAVAAVAVANGLARRHGGAAPAPAGPSLARPALSHLCVFVLAGASVGLRGANLSKHTLRALGADDGQADSCTGVVEGVVDDSPTGRTFVVESDDCGGGGTIEVTIAHPAPAVAAGDSVRLHSRLRTRSNFASDGARPGPGGRAQLVAYGRAKDLQLLERGGPSFYRWATFAQRRASARLWRGGSADPHGALLAAMVVGDRRGLDPSLRQPFSDSGVAHVLAVSGLHVGLVAWLLFGALRRGVGWCGPLCRRWDAEVVAAPTAALGALGFAAVAGGRVSTVRALIVVGLVLGGLFVARRVKVIDALGAAALALMLWNPSVVGEVSFQLSFAAATVLSVALARRRDPLGSDSEPDLAGSRAGYLSDFLGGSGRRLASLLRASLWAQLATTPIVAWWFGELPLAGAIANLTVVPLVELVVVPFALAGLALSLVSNGLAAAVLTVARWGAGWIDLTAISFAEVLPPLSVGVVSAAECVLAAVVVLAWLARCRGVISGGKFAYLAGSCVAWVAASYLVSPLRLPAGAAPLVVEFVDVGQGDAALVSWPDGTYWLVDAGGLPYVSPRPGETPSMHRRRGALPAERSVVPLLEVRGVDRLAVVVLSHRHPDHYGGLAAIVGRFPIDELWMTSPSELGDGDLAALVRELQSLGTNVLAPELGARDKPGGITVEVMAPRFGPRVARDDPVMSVNDNSLVLRITRHGARILFTGDLEGEGEDRWLAEGDSRAHVVKVAHHGSRTSSSNAFVTSVAAGLVVISCGKGNGFGFPAAEVVKRWAATGSTILRTDRDGTVRVEIDPAGALSYRTHRRR